MVGDRAVKGLCKAGVLGTVGVPMDMEGKGYEGVLAGYRVAGVGRALPLTVLLDSVDAVWDPVGMALVNDDPRVGERPVPASSTIVENLSLADAVGRSGSLRSSCRADLVRSSCICICAPRAVRNLSTSTASCGPSVELAPLFCSMLALSSVPVSSLSDDALLCAVFDVTEPAVRESTGEAAGDSREDR